MRALVLASLWMAALIGCGSDTSVLFHTSFGSVTADASCSSAGGQFPLRDEQGFTLTVIVTEQTTIVRANGNFGTCGDIIAGTRVRVRGPENDGRIDAGDVQLLAS
jgi:hypothetical protein